MLQYVALHYAMRDWGNNDDNSNGNIIKSNCYDYSLSLLLLSSLSPARSAAGPEAEPQDRAPPQGLHPVSIVKYRYV